VDAVGTQVLEVPGVVATLQEEGAPHGCLAEPLLQFLCLPREHQRRQLRQPPVHGLQVAPWLHGTHGPESRATPVRRAAAQEKEEYTRIRGAAAAATERDQRRSSGERGLRVRELKTREREESRGWVVTTE
jgi:hypothetical protein